jgi:hypothetical protein
MSFGWYDLSRVVMTSLRFETEKNENDEKFYDYAGKQPIKCVNRK